jgi:hypothetical protein
VNNEANLGGQNGGFTEFGEVTSAAGLAVMDAMAAFPTIDGDPSVNPGQFDNLAVQNSGDTVDDAVATRRARSSPSAASRRGTRSWRTAVRRRVKHNE